MLDAAPQDTTRLAYTIDEFGKATGIPRTTIYDLIAEEKLRTYKVGRRRYVSAAAARDFIAQMEAA